MKEKIEWYKEVLELEPSSKVFFPLARMLAEEGDHASAIQVLRKGLARHEEFLEARLFLIELLYKNGDQEECDREVDRLSSTLSSYAGFWEAWAACLSKIDSQADTATILRFLGANFICGQLSIHDVLNRGLSTILKERKIGGTRSGLPNPQLDDSNKATKPVDVSPDPAVQSASQVPPSQAAADIALPNDIPADSPPQEDAVAPAIPGSNEAMLSDLHQDKEEQTVAPSASTSGMTDVHARMEKSAPKLSDEPLKKAVDTIENIHEKSDIEPFIADTVTQGMGAFGSAEPDDADSDNFSLRTRSMAEVLAEQGDYRGALDIYSELAAAAISSEEKHELAERISMLTAHIDENRSQNFVEPAIVEETGAGQNKLISMLEALAQRVEARAQG